MLQLAQTTFSDPKLSKRFDWGVFYAGFASLAFAVAMTVLGTPQTQNAQIAAPTEANASL
jgi:hypothetical protein